MARAPKTRNTNCLNNKVIVFMLSRNEMQFMFMVGIHLPSCDCFVVRRVSDRKLNDGTQDSTEVLYFRFHLTGTTGGELLTHVLERLSS
jgi:hypothetical protein